jgi:hypothetical protein
MSLDELERWMLSAITHPAGLAHDAAEVAAIIAAGKSQTSAERLGVYHHAYFARLLESLQSLLPCTRYAVGIEEFDLFALDYLHRHPPRSYTLALLADRFATFLDSTRPPEWGVFLVELVQLEQAIERIFDGPGPENLPPFQLPPDPPPSLCLECVPSFELHAFQHPISTFYTDWKQNRVPTWPEKQPQYIALYRKDYIVRRLEISALQFQLLTSLHRGDPLNIALEQSCASFPPNIIQTWFQFWAAQGIFASP